MAAKDAAKVEVRVLSVDALCFVGDGLYYNSKFSICSLHSQFFMPSHHEYTGKGYSGKGYHGGKGHSGGGGGEYEQSLSI